jgi:cytochrome c oxidase cbb3-type subunit 3
MHDHNYDGISELDNKLPRWWVWLFNLTTVFAVIYLAYYHLLKVGPGQEEAHRRAGSGAAQAALAPAVVATTGETAVVAAAVEEPSTDDAVLATGKQIFTVNCAVCHGQNGEGLIGPTSATTPSSTGPPLPTACTSSGKACWPRA